MNIMREYTFHHLRKNKRYTISIMVAITIASALLCSLSIYGHTLWKSRVDSVIKGTGYWHGELWDNLRGDKLKYVIENPNVETTLIKGHWITAKLSNTKRSYLLMRGLDENYWRDMSEKNALLEGRLPEKQGEILISKLFFNDNPSYKIGDTLDLPIGIRMIGNKKIDTQEQGMEGETFKVTGNETYTIVGKLDMTAISAYPGYITMGYLERSQIKPEDELTVYMRMKNPRKIYETLPEIAQSVGFQQDEHGKYSLRYNKALLSLYGIMDKGEFNLSSMTTLLVMIITVFLAMGAFVLIIYNAFSLSANSRMKQLGILKSLGATPNQIKYSVIYEGFILCIFPIPIGMIIGYLFSNIVVYRINEILSGIESYKDIQIAFSLIVIVFAGIMSLITVLISANITASRIAKILPIESIRQNNNEIKIKKEKSHPIIKKVFGIEGELAINQLSFHKRTFRTAIISLSMCFVLITGYIGMMSISDLNRSLEQKDMYYDMSLGLNIAYEPNNEMINEILSLKEIKDNIVIRTAGASTYVESNKESDAFKNVGGFAEVDSNKYNVVSRDGKYRIFVYILGLDDMSFEKYCKEIGINTEEYYNEGLPKGVLVNSTYHEDNRSSRNTENIPLLNVKAGDELLLWEQTRDEMETSHKFNIEAGYITDIFPDDDIKLNRYRYSLAFVVPMESYDKIVSEFMPERALSYRKLRIHLLVGDEASLKVKEKLTQICESYLGAEDFNVWSRVENEINGGLVNQAFKFSWFAIAFMFGAIGTSNAFSTIANNLKLRRREFAMLRSVGLTPKGLNKILVLEGMFFGFKPILVSIPFLFMIYWFVLWAAKIKWLEFLPFFPVGEILIYTIVIIGVVWASYGLSAKSIKKDNVVDAIKDETL